MKPGAGVAVDVVSIISQSEYNHKPEELAAASLFVGGACPKSPPERYQLEEPLRIRRSYSPAAVGAGAGVAGFSAALPLSAPSSLFWPKPPKSEGAVPPAGTVGAGDVLEAAGVSGFLPKRFPPPKSEFPAGAAGVDDGAVGAAFSAGFAKKFGAEGPVVIV